jgi:hypothetical protein
LGCAGEPTRPHRTSASKVALSRRLSDAAAARTTRHWRREDGLRRAAELLITLPVRHAGHTPKELAALFCAFAGVKRYETRVQRAAVWAAWHGIDFGDCRKIPNIARK